jgi:hypothetical protein
MCHAFSHHVYGPAKYRLRYRDGNGIISMLNGNTMPCWRWEIKLKILIFDYSGGQRVVNCELRTANFEQHSQSVGLSEAKPPL